VNHHLSRAGSRVAGAWRVSAAAFLAVVAVAAWGPAAVAAPAGSPGAVRGTVAAKAGGAQPGLTITRHTVRPSANDASGDLGTVLSTSGHGGYVSAGVAMRNQGYGTITITGIPEHATVKSATLIWDVLDDSPSAADATGVFDDTTLTGTLEASGPSPCWYTEANYAYQADVTSLVDGNGSYDLSGFSSGDTNGQDPWDDGSDAPLLEGASLVVIYADAALPMSDFQIDMGAAESDSGNSAEATLDGFTVGPAAGVTTTYIVADGQDPGNTAAVGDDTLDDVSFSGTAPQAAPAFSQGDLWDNQTASIDDEVSRGDTSVDLSVTGEGDCIVWVGQVLDVAGATVLGLGDSIAAGYGIGWAGGYDEATATGDNASAYPNVLAKELDGTAEDVAIEGACADDVESYCRGTDRYPGGKTYDQSPVSTQLSDFHEEAPWFTPTVVTLDIGANDIAFSTCLQDLLKDNELNLAKEPDNPCTSDKAAKHTLADSLNELRTGLADDLTQIQADYPDAQILLMNYYNPVAPEITDKQSPCAMSYGIVANNVYSTKSSIADVVSQFVLHPSEATAKARTAQNALYADASGIVNALNETINGVAGDFSGVSTIQPTDFAAHNACAGGAPWLYVPRVDLSLTYVTYEKQSDGKWKTVTKSRRELFGVAGGDACPAPSVNESSKKTDIYLTDNTGVHKPRYVLSLTLSSNCFPHPTPLGQQQLAAAFHAQAKFGPPPPDSAR
jgi:lysophospholipase L1-like esterase